MVRLRSFIGLIISLATLPCNFVAAQKKSTTSTAETSVMLRTHSIYAPYVDSDLQNRWFSFGADAYVNTHKHIRLTRDVSSQCGWLWSRLPLTAPSFQIEVEFKISGKPSHLYGDGMAIWLTSGRAEPGPVFCSQDRFEGLGIFIDTYANGDHDYLFPIVMAMMGDGKTHYDVGRDGEPQSIGRCEAKIRRTDIPTKIRITHLKGASLEVQLQYRGIDEWSKCFTLHNITLPASPYLGVTAQTGEVFDNHDVIAISTQSLVDSQYTRGTLGDARSSVKTGDVVGSGFWAALFSLVKVVFFLALCVLGFAGYRAWAARQSQWSNKRF